MTLPVKINPCPITEAVIELRFEPSVERDAVFGILYQKLKGTYSDSVEKTAILQLPQQLRDSDPDLIYQPYYRLKRENFITQIGPNVVSVSATGEYPGWQTLKDEFVRVFGFVKASDVASSYSRFALRYINNIKGDVTDKMKWVISLGGKDLTKLPLSMTSVITDGQVSSTFRFRNDMKDKAGDRLSVIDIDSVLNAPVLDFEERIDEYLDIVHLSEKEIFFSSLTEEYIHSLNPEYVV